MSCSPCHEFVLSPLIYLFKVYFHQFLVILGCLPCASQVSHHRDSLALLFGVDTVKHRPGVTVSILIFTHTSWGRAVIYLVWSMLTFAGWWNDTRVSFGQIFWINILDGIFWPLCELHAVETDVFIYIFVCLQQHFEQSKSESTSPNMII